MDIASCGAVPGLAHPPLPAFVFRPPGTLLYNAYDDVNAPYLNSGDVALVDATFRRLVLGELYLLDGPEGVFFLRASIETAPYSAFIRERVIGRVVGRLPLRAA